MANNKGYLQNSQKESEFYGILIGENKYRALDALAEARQEVNSYPDARERLTAACRFAQLIGQACQNHAQHLIGHFYDDFRSNWLPEHPVADWPAIDSLMREILRIALPSSAQAPNMRDITPQQEILPPVQKRIR